METYYGEKLVAKANPSHPSLFAQENKYSKTLLIATLYIESEIYTKCNDIESEIYTKCNDQNRNIL